MVEKILAMFDDGEESQYASSISKEFEKEHFWEDI